MSPVGRVALVAGGRDGVACQPAGRVGTPADIAVTAVWLASDEAGFVTGQLSSRMAA